MLDEVMGAYGSRFLLAAGGVGIALLVLIGVLWLLRNRAPSPFVRGGKNRQPRLQVLDAAAVDARRRLVLVRRDDVEHLIMIGGPSDIVIESRILPETGEDQQTSFAPSPSTRPAPMAAPVPALAEAEAERPAPRPLEVQESRPEPRPEPKPEPVAIFEEDEAEQEIYVPAPAPVFEPRPQPVAPVSISPAPVPAPPPAAPVRPSFVAPVPQPAAASAETRIPPQIIPRPVERPPVAPLIEASSAADILDAARARVLPQQGRVEPQISSPPAQSVPAAAQATPAFPADAVAPPQAPRGDFQRILEEEMNTNMMAERVVPVQSAPVRTIPQQPGNLPRRDPEMAPITGADAELQREVARIFGEMSVNRDK